MAILSHNKLYNRWEGLVAVGYKLNPFVAGTAILLGQKGSFFLHVRVMYRFGPALQI